MRFVYAVIDRESLECSQDSTDGAKRGNVKISFRIGGRAVFHRSSEDVLTESRFANRPTPSSKSIAVEQFNTIAPACGATAN